MEAVATFADKALHDVLKHCERHGRPSAGDVNVDAVPRALLLEVLEVVLPRRGELVRHIENLHVTLPVMEEPLHVLLWAHVDDERVVDCAAAFQRI